MSKKDKTYDQAEATQAKAVRFLRDVVGDPDKADEIESLSVEEYADRKGLQLMNPADERQPIQANRSNRIMADQDDNALDFERRTKAELVEQCEADDALKSETWNVLPFKPVKECTREELETAVEDVIEILNESDPDAFPLDDDDADDGQEEEAAD